MFRVLPYQHIYWPGVWDILEPIFRTGETYGVDRDISEADAQKMWVELPVATYVAVGTNNAILGSFYLKANQGGPGAHVCNAGYVVSDQARGQGIASMMCEFSQNEAIRLGFEGMQYNFVASTNEGAVRLWKKHGFQIVGTLPKAFAHPKAGYVDAFVMFKSL